LRVREHSQILPDNVRKLLGGHKQRDGNITVWVGFRVRIRIRDVYSVRVRFWDGYIVNRISHKDIAKDKDKGGR
jgi:hypothetical protein